MNLGKVLSDWRFMNKMNKADAAAAIGITPSALTQLEEGREVMGTTIGRVFAWLASEPLPPAEAKQAVLAIEGPKTVEQAAADTLMAPRETA